MSNAQNQPGVSMSKAHEQFCRPDLLEQYMQAGNRASWTTGYTASKLGGLTPQQAQRRDAVIAYESAWNQVVNDLVTKLQDGRLVGLGYLDGSSGRDLDAPLRRIPDDVIMAKDRQFGWRKETISGNGLNFVGVHLCPLYEAPEFPTSLIGCDLTECFRRIVIDDWVRKEMEEPVFNQYPEWRCSPDSYYSIPANRWPVRFETWSDAASQVASLNYTSSAPPECIVLIQERIDQQVRQLICWLRDATLVADGVMEHENRALKRGIVATDWWSRGDVEFNPKESTLWDKVTFGAFCVFSSIRIISPESIAKDATPAQTATPTNSLAPKGNRGPKLKWDWEAATREMMRLANSIDGLPTPQAEIEKHFQQWFMDNYQKSPAVSTIRDFIVRRLPPDYRQEI